MRPGTGEGFMLFVTHSKDVLHLTLNSRLFATVVALLACLILLPGAIQASSSCYDAAGRKWHFDPPQPPHTKPHIQMHDGGKKYQWDPFTLAGEGGVMTPALLQAFIMATGNCASAWVSWIRKHPDFPGARSHFIQTFLHRMETDRNFCAKVKKGHKAMRGVVRDLIAEIPLATVFLIAGLVADYAWAGEIHVTGEDISVALLNDLTPVPWETLFDISSIVGSMYDTFECRVHIQLAYLNPQRYYTPETATLPPPTTPEEREDRACKYAMYKCDGSNNYCMSGKRPLLSRMDCHLHLMAMLDAGKLTGSKMCPCH